MRKKAKNISRKEFIRSSSYGVIGTGLMANPPLNLFFPAESLKKISLGNTGIRLTKLGFGASRTQQASLLKYALDQGVTFIDTGRSYASGKNEEMVGSVIKGIRSDLTIQSKVRIRITNSSEESDSGSIHQRISDTFFKSLRESLQALQTDYIDIFLLHGASGEEEIYNEALLNAFNRAKEQGKIRAAGFSTHSNQAELVKSVNQKSSYNVIMVAFNPSGGYVHSVSARQDSWNQEELIRELKTATEKGIGIIGMKTCSGGPYSLDNKSEPSLPQAVQWVLQQEYIHAAAVAMANFKEVDEHVMACRKFIRKEG